MLRIRTVLSKTRSRIVIDTLRRGLQTCAGFASKTFSGTLGADSVKYLMLGHSANKVFGTNHFSDQRDSAFSPISMKKPRSRSNVHDLTKPFSSWAFPVTRTFVPGGTASCARIKALHSPISSKLPSNACAERRPHRRATDTSSEQR